MEVCGCCNRKQKAMYHVSIMIHLCDDCFFGEARKTVEEITKIIKQKLKASQRLKKSIRQVRCIGCSYTYYITTANKFQITQRCPSCKEITKHRIRMTSKQLPKLDIVSYFLIKPEYNTHEICHNANTKLCKQCQEECDLARGFRK